MIYSTLSYGIVKEIRNLIPLVQEGDVVNLYVFQAILDRMVDQVAATREELSHKDIPIEEVQERFVARVFASVAAGES